MRDCHTRTFTFAAFSCCFYIPTFSPPIVRQSGEKKVLRKQGVLIVNSLAFSTIHQLVALLIGTKPHKEQSLPGGCCASDTSVIQIVKKNTGCWLFKPESLLSVVGDHGLALLSHSRRPTSHRPWQGRLFGPFWQRLPVGYLPLILSPKPYYALLETMDSLSLTKPSPDQSSSLARPTFWAFLAEIASRCILYTYVNSAVLSQQ